MLGSAAEENVWLTVHPHVHVSHCESSWHSHWLLFIVDVVLNVSIVIFYQFELTFRADSSRVTDPCDLSSKIVLLLAEEEWVGVNVPLKVSSEQDLDSSGCLNVLRRQVG